MKLGVFRSLSCLFPGVSLHWTGTRDKIKSGKLAHLANGINLDTERLWNVDVFLMRFYHFLSTDVVNFGSLSLCLFVSLSRMFA